MPVIYRLFGIVIKMYYDDHVPPHFHAEEAEKVGVFTINNLQMIEGNLSTKSQKIVIDWAKKHQNALQIMWDTQQINKL